MAWTRSVVYPRRPYCMDIIEEVLVRLPVKSIIRFKCVCKSWHDTITSTTFINLQLERARKSDPLMLVARDKPRKFKIVNIFPPYEQPVRHTCTFHSVPLGRLDGPFDDLGLRFEYHGNDPLVTCNGLVCLPFEDRILIYNPSIRAHKLIPLSPACTFLSADSGYHSSYYVFGHAPRQNDYKVIRIINLPDLFGFGFNANVDVRVYSLKDDSWKRGNTTLFENMIPCSPQQSQRVFHGATYVLLVYGAKYENSMIARFDMDEETYEIITTPPDYGNGLLYLEVMDDRLAFFVVRSRTLDVWILARDADVTEEPWTRIFSISRHNDDRPDNSMDFLDHPITFWRDKFLFLKYDSTESMYWLEAEKGKVDVGVRGPIRRTGVIACISSLVPL